MNGGTILLVEDNPDDVMFTLRAFERNKISNEVVVAADGEQALECLLPADESRALTPALVLLDVNLPKVNGLEVLQKVRSTAALRSMPVVMLTSSQEESDVVRSYTLGVNAYVVKPVEFKQFITAIADLGMFWAVLNEPPPRLRA